MSNVDKTLGDPEFATLVDSLLKAEGVKGELEVKEEAPFSLGEGGEIVGSVRAREKCMFLKAAVPAVPASPTFFPERENLEPFPAARVAPDDTPLSRRVRGRIARLDHQRGLTEEDKLRANAEQTGVCAGPPKL